MVPFTLNMPCAMLIFQEALKNHLKLADVQSLSLQIGDNPTVGLQIYI
jgi:hypothetical protein